MEFIRNFLDSFNADSEDEDDRRKKKAQILYSGSVQNQTRRGEVAVRRAKSSVNAKINENEVLSSYTNIDSPTRLHESDSAFGSGFEDNDEPFPTEHRRLRRVESRERVVGNEQYIVVDFIGNLDIKSTVKKQKREDESPDSTALSVSPTVSVHSAFEEISTSDVPSSDIPSPLYADDNDDSAIGEPQASYKKAAVPIEEPDIQETVEERVENEAPFINGDISVEEDVTVEDVSPPKEKYHATKGLKKVYEERSTENNLENNSKPSSELKNNYNRDGSIRNRTDSQSSLKARQSIDTKPSPNLNYRSKRSDSSASNSSVSSRGSNRKTSLRSNPSDASVKSIVMQNKLLFDKQIAEENKRKYGSMTSLEAKPKKLDIAAFERNNSARNSWNNDRNLRSTSTEDIRIGGIVADTRDRFENDSKSVRGISFKKRDPDKIQTDNMETPKTNVYIDYTNTDLTNIANKEASVKKKKKGIFKKKKKNESFRSDTDSINEIKPNKVSVYKKHDEKIDESVDTNDERKKRGLLSLIRKRSKSTDSDSKPSKQNSLEIDISLENENEIVFNDTESTKLDNSQMENSGFDKDNEIKVSANLENNLSVVSGDREKSYVVSVENNDASSERDIDIATDKKISVKEYDADVESDISAVQNDLQAIVNRQASNKSKKKNIFKKKKKNKTDSDDNLLASANVDVDRDVDLSHENETDISENLGLKLETSKPELAEISNIESENLSELQRPNENELNLDNSGNLTLDTSDDIKLSADPQIKDVITVDQSSPSIDATVYVNAETQNISNSPVTDNDIKIEPRNTIGDLVFERPKEEAPNESVSIIVPQISVSDESNIAVDESTPQLDSPIAVSPGIDSPNVDQENLDVEKRNSFGESDDELVKALDLANKATDDTTSYASYASAETSSTMSSPKKKKKFPFHIKGTSKKEKKEKKELNGDANKLSVKSSKKNKRPKSLDLSNTDLSLSSSNLDISGIDSPEKTKKKRIGLFRSKKKKHAGNESPSKQSPDKAKPFPNIASDSNTTQHALMSSDEFTIPESTNNSASISADVSIERRRSDGSEYSKQASLIEIERSEELQF